MAEIKRIWRDSKPPKPDVYLTRRGDTKHSTLRFWDGVEWWSWSLRREGATPKNAFLIPWTNKSYEPRPPLTYPYFRECPWSRKVTVQAGMKWGERYWHYSDTEILNHLIINGDVPPTIRELTINELNGRPVL